jgi:hypothetical protein
MELTDILPEIAMAGVVLIVSCAVGASAAAQVAGGVAPKGPTPEQVREKRVAERKKLAARVFDARRCGRPTPIGLAAPSDCPKGLSVDVSVASPMPDLDTSQNLASNLLDDSASSVWCGLVAGGQVIQTFSTTAKLEKLHVELTEKDPKGRPCAKNPKIVLETDGSKATIQLDDKLGRATDVPLEATTKKLTVRVEVQNTWPGQMFCLGALRATGHPSTTDDTGSTVLGLADGSGGWAKAQSAGAAAPATKASAAIDVGKRPTGPSAAATAGPTPTATDVAVTPTASAAATASGTSPEARKACISGCVARCSDDPVCEGVCARNCN